MISLDDLNRTIQVFFVLKIIKLLRKNGRKKTGLDVREMDSRHDSAIPENVTS